MGNLGRDFPRFSGRIPPRGHPFPTSCGGGPIRRHNLHFTQSTLLVILVRSAITYLRTTRALRAPCCSWRCNRIGITLEFHASHVRSPASTAKHTSGTTPPLPIDRPTVESGVLLWFLPQLWLLLGWWRRRSSRDSGAKRKHSGRVYDIQPVPSRYVRFCKQASGTDRPRMRCGVAGRCAHWFFCLVPECSERLRRRVDPYEWATEESNNCTYHMSTLLYDIICNTLSRFARFFFGWRSQ